MSNKLYPVIGAATTLVAAEPKPKLKPRIKHAFNKYILVNMCYYQQLKIELHVNHQFLPLKIGDHSHVQSIHFTHNYSTM